MSPCEFKDEGNAVFFNALASDLLIGKLEFCNLRKKDIESKISVIGFEPTTKTVINCKFITLPK
jgi:hypothetical protein